MDVFKQLLPLILMTAVLYFVLIVPQNKRKKEFDSMMASLKVNDEIITKGGIIGKIVNISEDSFIIQTGPDRTRIKIVKAAVLDKVKDNTAAAKEPVKEPVKEEAEAKDVKVEENKEF
ncbi:MAG: preprotein translocase, YajC subunit [Firmicutes bacterium]|nr:preprotein translocase, YajC subunit [Bacillota bacterium]